MDGNSNSNLPKSFSKPPYPWELCGKGLSVKQPSETEINRVKTVIGEIIPDPSLNELETFFTE